MKLKIIKSLTLIGTLLFSFSALALKNDTQQPINITSDNQSLDLEKNIVTFSDNVVITQGSILINADKVTIIRPADNGGGKEKIEALGNPVTFQQQLDNGRHYRLRSHSFQVRLSTIRHRSAFYAGSTPQRLSIARCSCLLLHESLVPFRFANSDQLWFRSYGSPHRTSNRIVSGQ